MAGISATSAEAWDVAHDLAVRQLELVEGLYSGPSAVTNFGNTTLEGSPLGSSATSNLANRSE